MKILTEYQCNRIYDILSMYAGARDSGRADFIYGCQVTESQMHEPCAEYRFMGSLGFGGKFRNNGNKDNSVYIDCYSEDETPERLAIIKKVNILLKEI